MFQSKINAAFWVILFISSVCLGQQDRPIGDDEGIPVVSWEDADSVVGRQAYVVGKVVRVGHAQRVHFLNFDQRRRDVFSVVIFGDNLEEFQPSLESLYEGKLIRIRGNVSRYRDIPQIVATSPAQIEVINALPKFSTPVPRSPRSARQGEVKVASLNVLNLFDDEDDPYRADETTKPKPRSELTQLANRILQIDADVLALQEVESRGYLQRFVDVFLPQAGYQHVVHLEGNDNRGIDVALLSRLPVGRVGTYQHLRYSDAEGRRRRLNRDLLTVEIIPEKGRGFEVWVVHLKSNSGGREAAEPVRLAEVGQIREIYDQTLLAQPDARILLCGDFNDTLDSKTLTTLMGSSQAALQTFVADQDRSQVTYNRGQYQSMIDFILASPAMAKSFVPDSYEILPGTVESSGSDHNPVSARFRLSR